MKPISFFIGLVIYAIFLLGKSRKDSSEPPKRYLCCIIGLIFSILLYYAHLLGVALGGFIGGFIVTVLSINDNFSYIISGILGFLFAAYGIKVLPSKVHSKTYFYFKVISSFLYFSLGLCMIFMPFGHEYSSLNAPSFIILGISYISVSLYAIFVHPIFTTSDISKSTPSESTSPKLDFITLANSDADVSGKKISLSQEPPVVSSASVPTNLPSKETPVCKNSVVPVEKSSPTGAQTIFVSQPKHVKHFFAKWIILASILFCLLGVAIGYLAGGGYLSPSLVPDSPYIQQLKQAEIDAASKNYDKGYRDGRNEGYASGREYGYEKGYVEGYDGAYDDLALLLDDYLG